MSEQENFEVACYLGHCGAKQKRNVIFEGTQEACEDYFVELPGFGYDRKCCYCGGYTGTVPVWNCCRIEEVD